MRCFGLVGTIRLLGLSAALLAPVARAASPDSTQSTIALAVQYRPHGVQGAGRHFRYYSGPAYFGPPYSSDVIGYCSARHRSYDPVTRTYLGRDGRRYPCPNLGSGYRNEKSTPPESGQ